MNETVSRGTRLLSVPILLLLGLPIIALVMASSPSDVLAGTQHPLFVEAIYLSAVTSLISVVLVIFLGTPLAWWLAQSRNGASFVMALLVDLPILIPPAVIGLALLMAFGREGLIGGWLSKVGVGIPFTMSAVIIAQVVVAAPFFIQSAIHAFRRVDLDLIHVARTLGHSERRVFYRVVIPIARPGLISGVALCWARALGEFGATLLFAGNLSGTTQTMPLAIYTALESDVRIAIALSLVLIALAIVVLVALRLGLRTTEVKP